MYINMYIMYIELAKGWTFHSPQTSHALAATNAPTSCRFSSIAVQASVAAEKHQWSNDVNPMGGW